MGKKSEEIKTLLRVQGWAVDEQRRMLGQLQAREDQLLADLDRLAAELLAEQQVASEHPTLAGHGYAAYAVNYRDRRANLMVVITALREEIEQQRERLAEAYRELKVLEQVQHNWLTAERIEAARIEQAEMDEVAQIRHQRKLI